ncbi:hypothetical protein [Saccharopolyspora cebuensis]|uniref:Uncharacterized protein n=1 Tax=Saccharopolyspora cebuensis TaxID=418759 RepID=A0ABV4CCR5_9PSEU
MSQPHDSGSLDQEAQQQLIQEIGRTIALALPPGWQAANVEYRQVGSHRELVASLLAPNGTEIPIAPPGDVMALFTRLRAGMYEPERGTWVSALYRLQRPGSYTVDFNGDHEPAWRSAPPAEAYAQELHRFPRTGSVVPEWLAQRAGAPHPGDQQPSLRTAAVFDRDGRPITQRPAVEPGLHEQLLAYLESAPIVLAARSFDTDRLDPAGEAAVPLTFHTDGSWIWPGAVGYYLRRHGVAPEDELVEHIRRSGFRLPEVDEPTRERVVAEITGEQRS